MFSGFAVIAPVCSVALSGPHDTYPSHMGSPWPPPCLSSAQPTCAHLTHNPNQVLPEATFRNQARNNNICRKSGKFIESSVLYSTDIGKCRLRRAGEGREGLQSGEKGGPPQGLTEPWVLGTTGLSFTSGCPLILQAPWALLLRLLKARERAPG